MNIYQNLIYEDKTYKWNVIAQCRMDNMVYVNRQYFYILL